MPIPTRRSRLQDPHMPGACAEGSPGKPGWGEHPPFHPASKSGRNHPETPQTLANYCHFIGWTTTLKLFKQVHAETMYLIQKRWVGRTRTRYFGVRKRGFLLQRAHRPEKPLTSPGQGRKDPKKCFLFPEIQYGLTLGCQGTFMWWRSFTGALKLVY